ncbi:Hypothetical protein D9617_5g071200 [Elsinoe fawcettii]|nr:Hypothetical protein D9617_5g071200 [Elsinoe fawcettii]
MPAAMIPVLKRLPLPSVEVHEEMIALHIGLWISSLGFSIAPTSSAVCCLGQGYLAVSRYESGVGDDHDLPEHALKISEYGNREGTMYLYDLTTKSIVGRQYDNNIEVDQNSPQGPADHALSKWIFNFRTLSWLPWRFATARYIDSRPMEYDRPLQNGSNSLTELDAELAKATFNQFNARRKIYEDCGWPDNFDLARFKSA